MPPGAPHLPGMTSFRRKTMLGIWGVPVAPWCPPFTRHDLVSSKNCAWYLRGSLLPPGAPHLPGMTSFRRKTVLGIWGVPVAPWCPPFTRHGLVSSKNCAWYLGGPKSKTNQKKHKTATLSATAPATEPTKTADHNQSIHSVINLFAFGSRLHSSCLVINTKHTKQNTKY